MEIDYKYFLKHRGDYLKLSLKIWTMRRNGEEPPKELIKQAVEIGRLARVSEIELKSL